jgi:Rhs element Vgr protein
MLGGDGLVIPTILVNGQALDDSYLIVSVDIDREVNRIPTASVAIAMAGAFDAQAILLGGGPFAPAAQVQIKLRQGDIEAKVFEGLVTGIGVRGRGGAPVVEVTLKDKAIRLNGARQNRINIEMTDAEAIRSTVTAHGLSLADAPGTQPTHPILVQYDATDWDFILARADAQALVVVVVDGALSLKEMAADGAATHSFTYGIDEISDFQLDLDMTRQRPKVGGSAWDSQNLGATAIANAEAPTLSQGGSGIDGAAHDLALGDERLVHLVPMLGAEVKGWTTGRLTRQRLALVRGRIAVPLVADLALMTLISLKGFGDRFDGRALVTGLRHRIDAQGFGTEIQFGLSPEPFGRTPDIADAPAHGLLPPISGLQLGIVSSTDNDPDGEARVKVKVPAIASDPASELWARIATPDAGADRGICFLPEVADEVVVGFLDNDPRHPVVLGRLHGSKNPPPGDFKDGKKKGILTKSGIKITMVEASNPSITIETKAGRKLVLDDDGKKVTLADSDGNTISFADGGVTIKSAKDLKIEADGAIKIKGSTIDLN